MYFMSKFSILVFIKTKFRPLFPFLKAFLACYDFNEILPLE